MTGPTKPTQPHGASPAESQEHMLGHGFYNDHSQEQHAANRYGLPHILEAVEALQIDPAPERLNIADYGSAQGKNSLLPMKTAVEALQGRWRPAPAISVIHTDLATNDWTSLFQTVLLSPESYLAGQSNVFCMASGSSVYQRIFPAQSIALGYSAIVEHWLSRKPGDIPGHIWSARAQGQAHEAWAAQARADWQGFLAHRAAELLPSGRLILVLSGADAQGLSGAEPLMDLVNEVLQGMVKRGTLSPAEYADMAIPTYYRTEQEWREPFADGGFAAEADLSLLHYQEFAMEDFYLDAFLQNHDAQGFANDMAAFFHAAFEPALFVSLGDGRGEKENERVIAAFSDKLKAALASDPPSYSARWWLAVMVITKE